MREADTTTDSTCGAVACCARAAPGINVDNVRQAVDNSLDLHVAAIVGNMFSLFVIDFPLQWTAPGFLAVLGPHFLLPFELNGLNILAGVPCAQSYAGDRQRANDAPRKNSLANFPPLLASKNIRCLPTCIEH
jgi:hypothetical protein